MRNSVLSEFIPILTNEQRMGQRRQVRTRTTNRAWTPSENYTRMLLFSVNNVPSTQKIASCNYFAQTFISA